MFWWRCGSPLDVRVWRWPLLASVLALVPWPVSAQGGGVPATPARPVIDSVAHNSVTLSWDDPGDSTITGYQILRRHRATQPAGVFSVIEDDTGSAATTYTDSTVEASTSYVYRIKAPQMPTGSA